MNVESSEITQAREHLLSFEKRMMDEDGIYHLSEGFTLLESALEHVTDNKDRVVAKNLGNTYASTICTRIHAQLEEPKATTEPKLEHSFKLLLELEEFQFGNKDDIGKLKVETVKKLLTEYFRGYTGEGKRKFVENFLKTSGT